MKYIQERKEQRKITVACHVDPTSGHTGMGIKKTVARIKVRFHWKGIMRDVEAIVSYYCVKLVDISDFT